MVQTGRLVRDGVGLEFAESGSGGPPILLIHGWACDRTYLEPQLQHLSARHRVLALDLRGHGGSDAPDQEYTMASFADDVAWLCGQIDLRRAVLVGHSMGAVVAVETAIAYPELVSALVALDAPVVMPAKRLRRFQEAGERLRREDFRVAARELVQGMFLATDDAHRRSHIVEAMSSGPRHVLVSAWERLFSCRSASAELAQPVAAPTVAIASARGHMADLQRLAELCPSLATGQTVGAGHFLQLEVPGQVNAMIDRFLSNLDLE